ncbi:hypothetical protein M8J76_007171 [Diaphorina citri]|nr:hypothetical protein M8J76_007171 [Diaphorina citri]
MGSGLIGQTLWRHFWHITDIHLDLDYTVGGDTKRNCRRSSTSGHNFRPAARYGDYNCDSPWELVRSAVRTMEEKHGEIEFILWTGDGVSELASYSSEQQFKALSNVTDILYRYFSSHFVIPVLGHDDPGSSRGGRYSYTDLGHLFEKWLPPDAIGTFNKVTISQPFFSPSHFLLLLLLLLFLLLLLK